MLVFLEQESESGGEGGEGVGGYGQVQTVQWKIGKEGNDQILLGFPPMEQEFKEGGPGGRMSYVQCCSLRVWKRQVTPSHIYSNSDAARAQPQTPLECDHRAKAFKFSAPAFGYNYWRLIVCVPLAEATSKHPCRLYGNIRRLRL